MSPIDQTIITEERLTRPLSPPLPDLKGPHKTPVDVAQIHSLLWAMLRQYGLTHKSICFATHVWSGDSEHNTYIQYTISFFPINLSADYDSKHTKYFHSYHLPDLLSEFAAYLDTTYRK